MEVNDSYIHFATVGGTFVDFSNLDLSPWGIQGGLVESKTTENFIRSISRDNWADRNWQKVKDISQSSDGRGGGWDAWGLGIYESSLAN